MTTVWSRPMFYVLILLALAIALSLAWYLGSDALPLSMDSDNSSGDDVLTDAEFDVAWANANPISLSGSEPGDTKVPQGWYKDLGEGYMVSGLVRYSRCQTRLSDHGLTLFNFQFLNCTTMDSLLDKVAAKIGELEAKSKDPTNNIDPKIIEQLKKFYRIWHPDAYPVGLPFP